MSVNRWAAVVKVALLALASPACGGSGGGEALPIGFVVTTSSLPVATQGTAYSVTLAASGGTLPYAWSLSAGALPAGLALNPVTGVINGTPGGLGLSTFTVQAVDSAAVPLTAARAFAISVTTSGAQYDPPWSGIAPTAIIPFTYNGGQTSAQNGSALKAALNGLTAGQKLVISAGTYSISSYFDLACTGIASAPITIEAAPGATVVFVQTNGGENVMNVGSGSPVRYVVIRGIEWTGGSEGVRFYDCANVWFDRNHVHDVADAAVTTNTHDTDHLYLTRNDIHSTGGTGEGMYLGANAGAVIMHDSVIALNHVHDTNGPTVTQGDGIELKQGSWGNLISENLVHDCGYPCILVDGTAGQPQNIVERNTCYNSGDNVLQIQGECIVRNNLAINGAGAAFASQMHQGNPANLQVVHNTFINSGRAASLGSWSGAAGMIFANNVCHSQSAESIQFSGGSAGVTIAGNVVAGPVVGAAGGFIATGNPGNPLADFTSVTWTATSRNALPVAGCVIIGAGNATYAVPVDITGATRVTGLEPGCTDRP
jgi:hypothetical protein